jgi:hypothetical protein
MATDVVMPQMGESITEGTLTKWLKKPGDTLPSPLAPLSARSKRLVRHRHLPPLLRRKIRLLQQPSLSLPPMRPFRRLLLRPGLEPMS